MKVVLNRIDERLIHGQLLVSWMKKLSAKQIIIVDNRLANDSFAETVLKMSLPSDVELTVMDIPHGAAYLNSHINDTAPNAMVLVKGPEVFAELMDRGYKPSEINIGGMSAAPSRQHLCKNIYASKKERELFKEFLSRGIDVYVQIVYAEGRTNIIGLL